MPHIVASLPALSTQVLLPGRPLPSCPPDRTYPSVTRCTSFGALVSLWDTRKPNFEPSGFQGRRVPSRSPHCCPLPLMCCSPSSMSGTWIYSFCVHILGRRHAALSAHKTKTKIKTKQPKNDRLRKEGRTKKKQRSLFGGSQNCILGSTEQPEKCPAHIEHFMREKEGVIT